MEILRKYMILVGLANFIIIDGQNVWFPWYKQLEASENSNDIVINEIMDVSLQLVFSDDAVVGLSDICMTTTCSYDMDEYEIFCPPTGSTINLRFDLRKCKWFLLHVYDIRYEPSFSTYFSKHLTLDSELYLGGKEEIIYIKANDEQLRVINDFSKWKTLFSLKQNWDNFIIFSEKILRRKVFPQSVNQNQKLSCNVNLLFSSFKRFVSEYLEIVCFSFVCFGFFLSRINKIRTYFRGGKHCRSCIIFKENDSISEEAFVSDKWKSNEEIEDCVLTLFAKRDIDGVVLSVVN